MLLTKVVSGFVVGGVIVASVLFWKYIWLLMVLGLSLVGSHELYNILKQKEYRVHFWLPIALNFIILIATFWLADTHLSQGESFKNVHLQIMSTQNMLMISSCIILLFSFMFHKPRATIAEISSSLFQVVYMGWFPSFLILLRFVENGNYFVLWSLTSVAFSDICGFFAGRYLGKHPFFQHLSPQKTIEGSVGGLIGCTAVAVSGSFFLPIAWWHALILGLVLGCLGQVSDLLESLLKRDAGIKDSGTLIPGHGGILDRVDSYVVVGVITYYYLINFVINPPGVYVP